MKEVLVATIAPDHRRFVCRCMVCLKERPGESDYALGEGSRLEDVREIAQKHVDRTMHEVCIWERVADQRADLALDNARLRVEVEKLKLGIA